MGNCEGVSGERNSKRMSGERTMKVDGRRNNKGTGTWSTGRRWGRRKKNELKDEKPRGRGNTAKDLVEKWQKMGIPLFTNLSSICSYFPAVVINLCFSDLVYFVDAMSSFGAIPLSMSSAHIDYLVSSANKCIEGVPGFSYAICRTEHLKSCKGGILKIK